MSATEKTWKTADMQYLLDVRTVLYGTFHRIFGEEPTKELLDFITLPEVRQAFEFVLEEYDALDADLRELSDRSSVDDLKGEYTRLFIGPNKLPAAPWESIYVNEESLLFQESTLKVRQTYLDEGFLPAGYPHVADDHLAIELDFMLRLVQKLAQDGLGFDDACAILRTQTDFLDKHLLVWVPLFEEALAQKGDSRFYSAAAHLLCEFLRDDRLIVAELADALEADGCAATE